jgi:hypothetical protein
LKIEQNMWKNQNPLVLSVFTGTPSYGYRYYITAARYSLLATTTRWPYLPTVGGGTGKDPTARHDTSPVLCLCSIYPAGTGCDKVPRLWAATTRFTQAYPHPES